MSWKKIIANVSLVLGILVLLVLLLMVTIEGDISCLYTNF